MLLAFGNKPVLENGWAVALYKRWLEEDFDDPRNILFRFAPI